MNDFHEVFDDTKVNKAIKKAKRKSIIKIIIVSILIFFIGGILNIIISAKLSYVSQKRNSDYIELTIPNGYISQSFDTIGFLGGIRNYTVCKLVGEKPVVLLRKSSSFGILPPIVGSMEKGAGYHAAGSWPVAYWENGYKKMMFFHPDIKYKEYKNDIKEINLIPDGKIIELSLSFDKKYGTCDLKEILPKVNISWLWLNTYTKKQMEDYKNQAKEGDSKACYISEFKVLGIKSHGKNYIFNSFDVDYKNLLDKLKNSYDKRHVSIYKELLERKSNPEILGCIVYGTKEDLKTLIGNPHIKGSSIGVVIDKY